MTPANLETRVRATLSLAPMTLHQLSRCLCASRGGVRRALDQLRASGDADTFERVPSGNGRPWNLWELTP